MRTPRGGTPGDLDLGIGSGGAWARPGYPTAAELVAEMSQAAAEDRAPRRARLVDCGTWMSSLSWFDSIAHAKWRKEGLES
jgi:hypothetical protein